MQPPYSPNVVNQTVSYGGQTWKGNPGQGWSLESSGSGSGSGGVSADDTVASAQKLLDFQKTANAPVSAALGSQVPGIQDEYTQLVNSIKGNQQLDTNRQTTTTNNLLAQRGISSNSNYSQQQLTDALTPIDTQYSGLLTNANQGSIQDLQSLALQIAQLNAGDPNVAISGALNLAGVQGQLSAAQQYAQAQIQVAQAQPYKESTLVPGLTLNQQTGQLSTSAVQNILNQLNGVKTA